MTPARGATKFAAMGQVVLPIGMLLVGLTVGYGLGAGGFAQSESTTPADRADSTSTAAAPSAPTPKRDRPSLVPALGTPVGRVGKETTSDSEGARAARTEKLTEELRVLEKRIAELEESIRFEQGRAHAFPEDLDPIYRQEKLLENLNRALAEADIASEISVVDCEEFPCVACGKLPPQAGEDVDINRDLESLQRASKSEALSVYRDGRRAGTVGTTRKESDGGILHQSSFCQSYYPKPGTPEEEAELKKRLAHRMSELQRGLE